LRDRLRRSASDQGSCPFQTSLDVTTGRIFSNAFELRLAYTGLIATIQGVHVHILAAVGLLAATTANGPSVHSLNFAKHPITQPALVKIPKGPNSLTLYNAKGERVAECQKKDDMFNNCKIEPGMTFDDVMNAWVHAFQDIESK